MSPLDFAKLTDNNSIRTLSLIYLPSSKQYNDRSARSPPPPKSYPHPFPPPQHPLLEYIDRSRYDRRCPCRTCSLYKIFPMEHVLLIRCSLSDMLPFQHLLFSSISVHSISPSIYLSLYLSIDLFILSIYLSIYVSLSLSLSLPLSLYAFMYVRMHVFLKFVCMYVYGIHVCMVVGSWEMEEIDW